jgi:peptide/nickel transport system permease protein
MSVASTIEPSPPRGLRSLAVLRAIRPRHVGMTCVCALLLVVAVCALAPGLLAPHDPLAQSLLERNLDPMSRSRAGALHVLGTDGLGRDVLSRMIYGARVSLAVGLSSVVVSSLIGIPLGLIAGYRGGSVDSIIMRIVDGIISFPTLVLAIFFLYVVGAGFTSLVLVLALMRWVAYVRVTRGLVLPYRSAAFVEAAKSVGCRDARIMFRHILPNIATPLLVLALLELVLMILAEAGLSFLGLGVPPPQPSWGVMIADGRTYMDTAWWGVVFPGLAITATTLGLSIVATAVRERSDSGKKLRLAMPGVAGVRRRDPSPETRLDK